MLKPRDPKELVIDLLSRSTCSVRVAAVIADRWGTFSWGINHIGFDGRGAHAEAEAIRRCNRKRLGGATIYVASERGRNGKAVRSRPCAQCMGLLRGRVKRIEWRDNDYVWKDW